MAKQFDFQIKIAFKKVLSIIKTFFFFINVYILWYLYQIHELRYTGQANKVILNYFSIRNKKNCSAKLQWKLKLFCIILLLFIFLIIKIYNKIINL